MLNKNKLEQYKELHKEFMEKVPEILIKKGIIEGDETLFMGNIKNIEFNNGMIHVELDGQYDDYAYCHFPENYLYNDNWEKELKKKIETKSMK